MCSPHIPNCRKGRTKPTQMLVRAEVWVAGAGEPRGTTSLSGNKWKMRVLVWYKTHQEAGKPENWVRVLFYYVLPCSSFFKKTEVVCRHIHIERVHGECWLERWQTLKARVTGLCLQGRTDHQGGSADACSEACIQPGHVQLRFSTTTSTVLYVREKLSSGASVEVIVSQPIPAPAAKLGPTERAGQ